MNKTEKTSTEMKLWKLEGKSNFPTKKTYFPSFQQTLVEKTHFAFAFVFSNFS
jgi:hypothetical protein